MDRNSRPLSEVAGQWLTPTANMITGAGHKGRNGGLNLQTAATVWPMPTADTAAYLKSNTWPTPTAMNRPRSEETLEKARVSRKAKAGQNTVPLYLEDLVCRISLPALATSTDGETSSPERRSLNPLFVEWLMGWPPGWTLLALPALTCSACSATALCLWKARMRSALSSLASPLEAPPAQLSFLEA